jgi:hypothetical protein
MQGKFSSLLWIDFVKTLLVARYSNINALCNMAFTEPTKYLPQAQESFNNIINCQLIRMKTENLVMKGTKLKVSIKEQNIFSFIGKSQEFKKIPPLMWLDIVITKILLKNRELKTG